MLKVKELLSKILSQLANMELLQSVDTATFTFSPKSANARGYVLIPSTNLLPQGATVVGMTVMTGNIANSNGAQFSPIAYNNNSGCYVNYYCPAAISGTVNIHVQIIYKTA